MMSTVNCCRGYNNDNNRDSCQCCGLRHRHRHRYRNHRRCMHLCQVRTRFITNLITLRALCYPIFTQSASLVGYPRLHRMIRRHLGFSTGSSAFGAPIPKTLYYNQTWSGSVYRFWIVEISPFQHVRSVVGRLSIGDISTYTDVT